MRNNRSRYVLDQSPLYKLRSRSKLAKLLGLSNAELRRISQQHNDLYKEFSIPKKDGSQRGVENPRRELKLAQKQIARLLCRIEPPDYLFCPVKRRCYVTNAAQHLNQRVIRCLDIRKYYPSTPSQRVYWFFRQVMKCERDLAATLTAIATYRNHLPTGSPLSPILAFFAYYDLWEEIGSTCRLHGYRLTVYVDDVTISGAKLDPRIIWRIKKLIHGYGLRYHKEKHYIDRPAEITGVIVHRDRLTIPHRQKRKLYLAQRELVQTKDPLTAEKMRGRVKGIIGQIAQVERASARPARTVTGRAAGSDAQ